MSLLEKNSLTLICLLQGEKETLLRLKTKYRGLSWVEIAELINEEHGGCKTGPMACN